MDVLPAMRSALVVGPLPPLPAPLQAAAKDSRFRGLPGKHWPESTAGCHMPSAPLAFSVQLIHHLMQLLALLLWGIFSRGWGLRS